ncbi:uncharacterized protein PgNI_02962 [Pyricularia grisea]|uniref:Chloramphenicol phosphotransferase-like protein n=1 Tax=Pyricularia grisea TaxID=148305 RepID=A0A6P8B9P0_PYRGI|nr:uncharacterized protein PgNI_02962 [Pyricularia grisea]TLD12539.1 hypothetical protein PgNI_02962 [Pyricularia grisea]
MITASQQSTGGRIVVLNGFPATGKLTILKEAKKLLPETTTCLMDNHLLIDPVAAIIPDRSPEHHELRRLVRAPIFQKLRQRAQAGYTILMTACLAEEVKENVQCFREHLDLVRGTDVPIFWVTAQCDGEVLEERISSPERCRGTKTKLTDVHALRDLLLSYTLVVPREDVVVGAAHLVVATLDANGPVQRLSLVVGGR